MSGAAAKWRDAGRGPSQVQTNVAIVYKGRLAVVKADPAGRAGAWGKRVQIGEGPRSAEARQDTAATAYTSHPRQPRQPRPTHARARWRRRTRVQSSGPRRLSE